jgi:hypothetical protein
MDDRGPILIRAQADVEFLCDSQAGTYALPGLDEIWMFLDFNRGIIRGVADR